MDSATHRSAESCGSTEFDSDADLESSAQSDAALGPIEHLARAAATFSDGVDGESALTFEQAAAIERLVLDPEGAFWQTEAALCKWQKFKDIHASGLDAWRWSLPMIQRHVVGKLDPAVLNASLAETNHTLICFSFKTCWLVFLSRV